MGFVRMRVLFLLMFSLCMISCGGTERNHEEMHSSSEVKWKWLIKTANKFSLRYDPAEKVRAKAAEELGRWGRPDADVQDALLYALTHDRSLLVRSIASQSLIRLGELSSQNEKKMLEFLYDFNKDNIQARRGIREFFSTLYDKQRNTQPFSIPVSVQHAFVHGFLYDPDPTAVSQCEIFFRFRNPNDEFMSDVLHALDDEKVAQPIEPWREAKIIRTFFPRWMQTDEQKKLLLEFDVDDFGLQEMLLEKALEAKPFDPHFVYALFDRISLLQGDLFKVARQIAQKGIHHPAITKTFLHRFSATGSITLPATLDALEYLFAEKDPAVFKFLAKNLPHIVETDVMKRASFPQPFIDEVALVLDHRSGFNEQERMIAFKFLERLKMGKMADIAIRAALVDPSPDVSRMAFEYLSNTNLSQDALNRLDFVLQQSKNDFGERNLNISVTLISNGFFSPTVSLWIAHKIINFDIDPDLFLLPYVQKKSSGDKTMLMALLHNLGSLPGPTKRKLKVIEFLGYFIDSFPEIADELRAYERIAPRERIKNLIASLLRLPADHQHVRLLVKRFVSNPEKNIHLLDEIEKLNLMDKSPLAALADPDHLFRSSREQDLIEKAIASQKPRTLSFDDFREFLRAEFTKYKAAIASLPITEDDVRITVQDEHIEDLKIFAQKVIDEKEYEAFVKERVSSASSAMDVNLILRYAFPANDKLKKHFYKVAKDIRNRFFDFNPDVDDVIEHLKIIRGSPELLERIRDKAEKHLSTEDMMLVKSFPGISEMSQLTMPRFVIEPSVRVR